MRIIIEVESIVIFRIQGVSTVIHHQFSQIIDEDCIFYIGLHMNLSINDQFSKKMLSSLNKASISVGTVIKGFLFFIN